MKRCLADRWDVNVIPEGTGQSTKLGIFLAVRKQSVVFFYKDSNLGLAFLSALPYLCIKRIYPLQTIQFIRCGSALFRYLPDRNNVIPEPKQEEAQI